MGKNSRTMGFRTWLVVVFAGLLAAAIAFPGLSFGFIAPVYSVTTPNDGNQALIPDKLDISTVSWGKDAENYYFKMNLYAAPSNSSYYEILIDVVPGSGGPVASLIGGTTSGVDYIIANKGNGSSPTFLHWNGLSYSASSSGPAVAFQKSGTILEWQVPTADFISTPYWFGGATRTGPVLAFAMDVTNNNIAHTPIPNAAWLLGSGVLCLIGLQRRRAKKG